MKKNRKFVILSIYLCILLKMKTWSDISWRYIYIYIYIDIDRSLSIYTIWTKQADPVCRTFLSLSLSLSHSHSLSSFSLFLSVNLSLSIYRIENNLQFIGYRAQHLKNRVMCIEYIYIWTVSLAQWVECSPMVPGDLGSIPGQVMPKTLKMVLEPPCLTLSNIRYVSRVKWSNPRKGVGPSFTPRCCSCWKRSLRVALDYDHQLYFYIYI